MIIVSTDKVLARALEVMLWECGITDCEIRPSLPPHGDYAVVDLDSADCDHMPSNALTISADRKKGADILRPFSESDFTKAVGRLLGNADTELQGQRRAPLTLTEKGFIYKGREVELTSREKTLFSLLYRNAGSCVSCEEIARVLERESADSSAITVYISFLRKKLDIAFGERIICNVRHKGYVLRLPE